MGQKHGSFFQRRCTAARVGRQKMGAIIAIIGALCATTESAWARLAYFMGATGYNDSTADIVHDIIANNYPEGDARRRSVGHIGKTPLTGTATGVWSYKLYSCNILISNLSATTQNLVEFAIYNFDTWINSEMLWGGQTITYDDPLLYEGGGIGDVTWSGSTTNYAWKSSTAIPTRTVFKFNHSALNSAYVVQSGSPAAISVLPGESVMIIAGGINAGPIAGGGLHERSMIDKPKQIRTCFGWLNVEDSDAAAPGFVMASGTLETKAGSYNNRATRYGNHTIPAAIYPPISGGTGVAQVPATWNFWESANCVGAGTNIICPRSNYTESFNPISSRRAVPPSNWIVLADASTQCDVRSEFGPQGRDGSINADWPEITLNTPITINGGSPF